MFLNSDTIRGEPRWHFVDGMTSAERRFADEQGIETAFCGSGAKAKAERAMRRIEQRDVG